MHIARLARRAGGAVALAGCLTLAGLANPAFAVPGNNGTIKIDGVDFDDHPNNEPHVGCTFQVDFYGYDEGKKLYADVTFKAHPPTGDRQELETDTVFIGEDDNSGGGSEAGLDASETYTLDFSGIEPHPKQGFHVKLTIHADGSQGADTKHKVFWVEGCDEPEPTDKPTHKPTDEPTHKPTDKPTDKPHDDDDDEPKPVPTAVPAGANGSGGGSAAGLVGIVTASGAVAGATMFVRRRRFLHDS